MGSSATREDVNRIEIQLRDAGRLMKRDWDTLQTAEPNQRSVERMLVDQAEGMPPIIEGILNQIEINRLANSEMRETMNRLTAELKRLSDGPLNIAGRELTSARKKVDSLISGTDVSGGSPLPMDTTQADSLSRTLAAAVGGQDDVVAALEKLVGELSGKTDYRQLIRQIAEVREDQLAHAKLAKSELSVETLPLEVTELSPAQRANLDKAADGQMSIAIRYAKIEHSMDQLARQLADDRDPMAGTISDALELSHHLTIGANMQQTATDLRENRGGQALEREAQIAGDLQQVLDVLRNEGEHRPQQLVDKLKQAEQRLAALQQQLEQLRQQIAQTEQAPNAANPAQLKQLGEQQQSIRRTSNAWPASWIDCKPRRPASRLKMPRISSISRQQTVKMTRQTRVDLAQANRCKRRKSNWLRRPATGGAASRRPSSISD